MYEVDTAKTGVAIIAAQNAGAIIEKYVGQSEYQKLLGYKNEILDLVSYDYSTLTEPLDEGPWSVINTFDGDPDTNVVCGGYAKSYQYLCDMGGLTCYYVTGYIPEGYHAWNVVALDGDSYLVDVTSLDTDAWGSFDQSAFLAGGIGSVETGYTITNSWGATLTYVYDEESKALWGEEVLSLASESYLECVHEDISEITTEPTETAAGVRTYTCTKCQKSYEETIPILEHSHNYMETVSPPTCTESGYTTYTCTGCGDSFVREGDIPTGHVMGD